MLPGLPEFNKEQRNFFADKIMDIANIGSGALVFGNLISDRRFELTHLQWGIIFYIFCFTISYFLTER